MSVRSPSAKLKRNQRHKERYQNDPQYRLTRDLRKVAYNCVKSSKQPPKNFLGCSREFFRAYIQFKFQDGMTWENYGKHPGWQLDHIKPLCSFDLTDPQQASIAFHYTNIQPLWAKDNLVKGTKI